MFKEKYSDFDTRVVRSLINDTQFMINEINEELLPFRFQISQVAIGIFHFTALVMFWVLYSNLEYYKSHEPIRINRRNKKNFMEFFISSLTKDILSQDISLASIAFSNIITSLYDEANNNAEKNFTQTVKTYEDQFTPSDTMKHLDNLLQLPENNIDLIMDCLLNPIVVLEKTHQEKWEGKTIPLINEITHRWEDFIRENLLAFKSFLEKFYNNLIDNNLDCLSIHLFQDCNVRQSLELNNNDNQNLQAIYEKEFQLLACEYLCSSFDNTWKNDEKIRDSIKLRPIQALPKCDVILNDSLTKNILTNIRGKGISKLTVFISEMIMKINDELNVYLSKAPNEAILDNKNLKREFLTTFIGCKFPCRLCSRKCDQKHNNEIDKHICSTGHFFKVFGGSKYEDNEPSFISCNSMKDNDDVIFEGNTNNNLLIY